MKFEELDSLIGRMTFDVSNFDSYKIHRDAMRNFTSYLRERFPPTTDDHGFWEREVPPEVIAEFQSLYDAYRKTLEDNTGEKLPLLYKTIHGLN